MTSQPPATLTLRWCPKCGQTSEIQMGLPNAHNPCWPGASPSGVRGAGPDADLLPRHPSRTSSRLYGMSKHELRCVVREADGSGEDHDLMVGGLRVLLSRSANGQWQFWGLELPNGSKIGGSSLQLDPEALAWLEAERNAATEPEPST